MIPSESQDHSTPPRPPAADIRRALATALAPGGLTDELERLVRSYVRTLKDAQVPPERSLSEVKRMVGAATLTPIPGRSTAEADRLAAAVVGWFLAEYYRAD